MGSSKKHKEKRDRKKHKKGRSRSRERDTHKRSHKSSSRREKRKSPERGSVDYEYENSDEKKRLSLEEEVSHRDYTQSSKDEHEKSPARYKEQSPDDDFDIDKLLESKLPDKSDSSSSKRSSKKRIREGALEEFKKRQKLGNNEDSLEKFANEQLLEEHGQSTIKSTHSPPYETPHKDSSVEIPFITDANIKEELPDEDDLTQGPEVEGF